MMHYTNRRILTLHQSPFSIMGRLASAGAYATWNVAAKLAHWCAVLIDSW